jgi:hypothetical protein
MQPNPRAAIVIGILPEDSILEEVLSLAKAHGFLPLQVAESRKAISHLQSAPELGRELTLIFLCSEFVSGSSLAQCIAELYQQRTEAARILIYALPDEWAGQMAMDCIRENAWDYIVRDLHDYEKIRERVGRAFSGLPPYSEINIPRLNHHDKAFIITPYGPPDARNDYQSGIVPALESIHLVHVRGDDERRPTFLLRKVCEQIDESVLVIANISKYGRSANANVYFEIGYALGRGKPVLLVRRANEQHTVPSDLNGIECFDYANCTDLALMLYFGLRGLVEPKGVSHDT